MMTIADDLLVGCEAIAAETGFSTRQIFYMAEIGQLPIFKIGNKLVARKSTLLAHILRLEQDAINLSNRQ